MRLQGNNAFCRIEFGFSVAKMPSIDINPFMDGIQTAQIVDNTQFFGPIIASGRGSSAPVTVTKADPSIGTTASSDVALGAGQLTDTAVVSGRVAPKLSLDRLPALRAR